ncbi:MAG TPA: hypothetical protein VMH78_03250 [Thermoplasmata archaeon]|nr:hypothetical protein [Thermoplasmata archaeon]
MTITMTISASQSVAESSPGWFDVPGADVFTVMAMDADAPCPAESVAVRYTTNIPTALKACVALRVVANWLPLKVQA